MAAGRHNLSRRALLGAGAAACALPAAAAAGLRAGAAASPFGPGPDPGLSKPLPVSAFVEEREALRQAQGERVEAFTARRWERALAAFRAAEAQLARLDADAPDDMFDDLECARLDALRRLLRAPAPDLPALAAKIDIFVKDQAWELAGAEPCLAALKADARRLLGGGPANSSA